MWYTCIMVVYYRKEEARYLCSEYLVNKMKRSEKDISVSCQDCIFIRRLSTCKEKGKVCNDCKNACCCKKCLPDVSGRKVPYELRHYFDAGIPILDYENKNRSNMVIETCQEPNNNSRTPKKEKKEPFTSSIILSVPLQEDNNGQMSLFW